MGSMAPEIRPATPADAPAVLALWEAAGAAPSATDDLASIERVAARGALLVARDGDEIVGSVIAAFDGWRGNVYRLAVAADNRRGEVARSLLAAGESRLAAEGCVRITALVLAEEDQATAFWHSAGYQLQPEIGRFVKTAHAHRP